MFLVSLNMACSSIVTATTQPPAPTRPPTKLPTDLPIVASTQTQISRPTATATSAPTKTPTLDISATPITDWRGIPIMPGSYDGEDEESQYTYKIDKDVEEVQAFYEPEMARLGWDLWAIGEAENGGGILFYRKDGINASIAFSDLSVLGLDYTLVILIY